MPQVSISSKKFNYEQKEPSTNWIIDCPFGGTMVVDVMVYIDNVLTKIIPANIKKNTDSQLEIVFSFPLAGWAHVVI